MLQERQGSFQGVGRFDLLFKDEFDTNILMELKARTAKYQDATQLAKYKDALTALKVEKRHYVVSGNTNSYFCARIS